MTEERRAQRKAEDQPTMSKFTKDYCRHCLSVFITLKGHSNPELKAHLENCKGLRQAEGQGTQGPVRTQIGSDGSLGTQGPFPQGASAPHGREQVAQLPRQPVNPFGRFALGKLKQKRGNKNEVKLGDSYIDVFGTDWARKRTIAAHRAASDSDRKRKGRIPSTKSVVGSKTRRSTPHR